VTDFSLLEQKLMHRFSDKRLLEQALTHRSYINENPEVTWDHNERLEFLGDAVLELAATTFLFTKYPHKNEGELTAYRSALVNATTLAETALTLGVNDFLLLSRGEAKDLGRARQAILANTCEAIIGAIFLDGGYEAAVSSLQAWLFPRLDQIVSQQLWQDAKSLFQEKAQALKNITPAYRVLHESGPDHDKMFTVGLYLDAELVAQGSGPSKQQAEQLAAQAGLEACGWKN
jgi:ribonuclease III